MKQNRTLSLAAVVIAAFFACGAPAATAVAQEPPADVAETFTVDGICVFPVLVEISGKLNTIELSGGRAIITAPGAAADLTNLDAPEKRETLGITGSFHVTFHEDGGVELEVTGRNLLFGFDPAAPFVLAVGRFDIAFDAGGNLVQPVSGDGRLIDVCELLD